MAQPATPINDPPIPDVNKAEDDRDAPAPAPTILLVAHGTMLVKHLQPALVQAGYAVVVASRGMDALDMLRVQSPDLVVIERQLPDVDGLELCSLLRRKASVPAIIFAPSADTDDTVAALNHGADDVIGGLCSPPEFVARVRTILRRSSRRKPGL